MAQPDRAQAPRGGRTQAVLLDDRFEIWAEETLENHAVAPSLAYRCVDMVDTTTPCVAIICDPRYPPRFGQANSFVSIRHPFLQKIIYHGVVDWTPENRRCPVVIAEMPYGERLMPSLAKPQEPMREEDLLMRVIRPCIRLLAELRSANLTHRSIRPTNLFWGDRSHSKVLLSECVSLPVAVSQPAIFETIETASCHPLGKGYGASSDDVYALAVTYFSLLTGQVPCPGMSDAEILNAKLLRGSYDLIVGDREFSRMVFEMFQGCLDDNPSTRWKVDDLSAWIGGKHYPLRVRPQPKKTGQPFQLGQKNFYTARHLAQGLRTEWEPGKALVASGDVDVWVRRYIADNDMVVGLNKAKEGLQRNSKFSVDRATGRVINILDPLGPLSYKSFVAMPDGIGILATLNATDADTQVNFVSLINSGNVAFWQQHYRGIDKNLQSYLQELELVRRDIRTMRFGHGLERFRYQLNPDLPCLSAKLDSEFVRDIPTLLAGLDRVAREFPQRLKKDLIDREIAAFIALKQPRDFRNEFQTIESIADPDQAAISQVKVLAILQQDQPALVRYESLCRVSANLLAHTLTKVRSAENRNVLFERMELASQEGVLAGLVDIADDQDAIERDDSEFVFAKAEYSNLKERISDLTKSIDDRDDMARIAGGHIASGVSGFVGCILAVAIFILRQFF